jgi:hypothetical protein
LSSVSRFLDWQRSARHDWVFFSFLAFAVLVSAFTGVQRVRFARALESFDLCAALADATCAGAELETARSIDPAHARTHIAHAELRALLGETGAAEQALSQALAPPSFLQRLASLRRVPSPGATAGQGGAASPGRGLEAPSIPVDALDGDSEAIANLDRSARGELLLALGDIAALKGQQQRARSRWTEASALVDADGLVKPRLDRMSSREDAGVATVSAELAQLRADFERFFFAVLEGAESVQFQSRDLNGRVRKIGSEAARNKLSLAVAAAERCVDVVRTKRHDADPGLNPLAPTWKPTPPTPPRSHAQWAQDQYQRELASYQQSLERAQTEENSRAYKRSAHLDELSAKIASTMDEARSLANEGFALARSAPPAAGTP